MGGHVSVLLKEALEFLNVKKGGKYVDATYGAGGHAEAIAERGGVVLGIDWDPNTISNLQFQISNVQLATGNFKNIEQIVKDNDFEPVSGVLFDLGISSIQLDAGERGFSFQKDEQLDMRIDPSTQGVTAANLVNSLREDHLFELFKKTSDVPVARDVARGVVRKRDVKKIETTRELAEIVDNAYRGRQRKISPATTIFLALRMAVNSELENLKEGLEGAFEILNEGGRLVVISFHSGEDRIVKDFIRVKSAEERMMNLTKNPVKPGEEEVKNNPRARSAKLRAAEKI